MMRPTKHEHAWLSFFGLIAFIVASYYVIRPILPGATHIEPLADSTALKELIAGHGLPPPKEETTAEFHGTKVVPPLLASLKVFNQVLGSETPSFKRIEVDLTNQKLYAFEGDRKVMEFPVSTGKWYYTPPGTYHIWAKVRSQLMSGGDASIGTYYYLPGVPYVMFFYNDDLAKSRGFSLHGTYWHNNFGRPMSHGCVNMRIEDAQVLYEWADPPVVNDKAWSTLASNDNPGTEVIIYGETPKE